MIVLNMANLLMMKTCTKCKISQPNDTEHYAMHKNCKGGLTTVCRECHKVYTRQPSELEKSRKRQREYRMKNRGRIKKNKIKSAYGLSKPEYIQLFEDQNYECGVCSTKITPFTKLAHVDHVHVDGYKKFAADEKKKYVRGMLCSTCNAGIGMLGDDVDVVLRAARYLLCSGYPRSPDRSP